MTELPLVLAGPMLRRTTASEVTVFVALKAARKVTLRVRQATAPTGPVAATGTRNTVALGTNLHVVAVTATGTMQPGRVYVYDLAFGPRTANDADTTPVSGTTQTLLTPGVVAADANAARAVLVYNEPGAPGLPSFALAPSSPVNLRVIHASCRKAHGEGRDALPAADAMVASTVNTADDRPHLLLLTGDQIYADDVADVLLAVATDAASALLGWNEQLPAAPAGAAHIASDYKPGKRADLVKSDAKLSTSDGGSHLLSFGEFCAMYVLAWGTAIWPTALPVPEDLEARAGPPVYFRRVRELREVKLFWKGLPAVRRALANIPTLMIFDDHEVTDDWNLRGSWSKPVLDPTSGSKLGRRIVQNGLAAYAVFQAWGNTPAQFAASGAQGQKGRALLTALSTWRGEEDGAATDAIRKGLGMPTGFDAESVASVLDGAVTWHYSLTTPSYELLVLDTRTHRASPGGENNPAALLGAPQALADQLGNVPMAAADIPVLVVSPTPVFGNPLMEWLVRVGETFGKAVFFDAETWGLQPTARERFLSALLTRGATTAGVKRRRVVLLCGDVHYGFSAKVSYAGSVTPDGQSDPVKAAIAQLTASPAKNESGQTGFLHWIGFEPFGNAIPRETVVGFANPVGGTISVGTSPLTGAIMASGTPAFTSLPEGATPASNADWRYDVEFLLADAESDQYRGPPPPIVDAPQPGDRQDALRTYLLAAGVHASEYVGTFGSGKEIVGRNTIGEVTFAWGTDDASKAVVHELWWALPGETNAFPLSRWRVSLANAS